MDPLACWKKLKQALKDGDIEEAIETAEDLESWQVKGGATDMLPDSARHIQKFRHILRDLRRFPG